MHAARLATWSEAGATICSVSKQDCGAERHNLVVQAETPRGVASMTVAFLRDGRPDGDVLWRSVQHGGSVLAAFDFIRHSPPALGSASERVRFETLAVEAVARGPWKVVAEQFARSESVVLLARPHQARLAVHGAAGHGEVVRTPNATRLRFTLDLAPGEHDATRLALPYLTLSWGAGAGTPLLTGDAFTWWAPSGVLRLPVAPDQ